MPLHLCQGHLAVHPGQGTRGWGGITGAAAVDRAWGGRAGTRLAGANQLLCQLTLTHTHRVLATPWPPLPPQLILPYLDLQMEDYDLGLPNRDATDDQVTVDAAHAILVSAGRTRCGQDSVCGRRGVRVWR